MAKLDRYLFREFTQSFLATLIVLLVVSLGGVMADLLGNIAEGRIDVLPAITSEVALSGVADAFAALADPESQCKVVVRPAL